MSPEVASLRLVVFAKPSGHGTSLTDLTAVLGRPEGDGKVHRAPLRCSTNRRRRLPLAFHKLGILVPTLWKAGPVSSVPLPAFDDATITVVSRVIGDLCSGPELTSVLGSARLTDVHGEGATKWRRLHDAVVNHQNRHQNGKAIIALIHAAMTPTRTLDRIPKARAARDTLNQVLSLSALQVHDDGRVRPANLARTDTEAHARATRLRALLEARGVHQTILDDLQDDWLRTDYYAAVFESIKVLGHRLRSMTGIDLDGAKLVDASLLGGSPPILITPYSTVTEQNEQRGVGALAKGLFSAFRNPQAHEPRSAWNMTEQDALDVLATLSLIHRRLDAKIRP